MEGGWTEVAAGGCGVGGPAWGELTSVGWGVRVGGRLAGADKERARLGGAGQKGGDTGEWEGSGRGEMPKNTRFAVEMDRVVEAVEKAKDEWDEAYGRTKSTVDSIEADGKWAQGSDSERKDSLPRLNVAQDGSRRCSSFSIFSLPASH
ncbi:hypothetical protein Acr_20g0010600 [Actinidia rufa]|uniref:Uncharacterized protein n=1 Tax=Actinidia rufa TaxID=165716 RepID=A0A7J0GEV0_9ERIC|nr:hypothetical protein Acr_20g0010600 [Actinidia rufa]